MAHIYIVEDDVNIREIEAFSLKNSGYTVEEFGSAKEFWSRNYGDGQNNRIRSCQGAGSWCR